MTSVLAAHGKIKITTLNKWDKTTMNYHNNTFPPRPPVISQWPQYESWNQAFQSVKNFQRPFYNQQIEQYGYQYQAPCRPAPGNINQHYRNDYPYQAACSPTPVNNFNHPSFQNQRHMSPGPAPQYSQGGNRGGYGNFTGGPRVPAPRGRGQGAFQGNSYNSNNNNRKSKKKKVDKRDLAENNQYFCDTCDRGFKTKDKYEEHVGGHEQCSVAGCPYIAAPRLVQLHYQMQHKNNLAKKVWSLESKEDVNKWIAERKKNFPTPGNIEKKETEQHEKRERGEILQTKQFGKFKSGTFENNGQDFHGGRGGGKFQRGRWANKKRKRTQGKYFDRDESSESSQKKRNLDSSEVQAYTQNSNGGDNQTSKVLNPNSVQGESKDEEEEEKPEEISKMDAIMNLFDSEGNVLTKQEQTTQDSVSDEKENEKEVSLRTTKNVQPSHRPADNENNQRKKQMPRKRITLLERLLAKEIRHERNVILQCVYYIVKKRFFDKKECEILKTGLASELKRANNSNSETCCIGVSNNLPNMDLADELQRADNSCNGEDHVSVGTICEKNIDEIKIPDADCVN